MNEICNFSLCGSLAEGNIICHAAASTGDEVIERLAERLAYTTAGLDRDVILNAVREREQLMPTVIAPGLAVPHARMTGVDSLLIAVATSDRGVDFSAPDGGKVRVTVLILTPADDPGLHLQVLSALAKTFAAPDAVDKAAALESPGAVREFFADAAMEIPPYLRVCDLMDNNPLTLTESDTLHTAIAAIAARGADEIPVLDDEGDLRGVVAAADILRFSLPEHILWMNDLTPILRFQPFAEMLKNSQDTKLADFMRETMEKIEEDAPAIQLVKQFITAKVRQVIVTRNGRFSGVVRLENVVRDLFWA
ncbi:MAG: PTS sugar transporter subunit IIA [Victivallaceae bacterium]|nr:PTS sugar transporter subunit IIA [Victivallaceae bacterium]